MDSIPAIVCNFDNEHPPGKGLWASLTTPMDVMGALGPIREVGVFEASHERIDLHNVVPD